MLRATASTIISSMQIIVRRPMRFINPKVYSCSQDKSGSRGDPTRVHRYPGPHGWPSLGLWADGLPLSHPMIAPITAQRSSAATNP
jgi:hypothetical protein